MSKADKNHRSRGWIGGVDEDLLGVDIRKMRVQKAFDLMNIYNMCELIHIFFKTNLVRSFFPGTGTYETFKTKYCCNA